MRPQPSLVAVDHWGEPQAFGFQAVRLWERGSGGMRLARPFSVGGLSDQKLAGRYLKWALASSGLHRVKSVPVLLALPAGTYPAGIARWRGVVESVGGQAMTVERPLAAALGMELDTGNGVAHMLVEVTDDMTEVAVEVDGVVVDGRILWSPPRLGTMAALIRRLLGSLDPDYEFDIRDRGIHLYGTGAGGLAPELSERLGVPTVEASSPQGVVIDGARRSLQEVLPYLAPA